MLASVAEQLRVKLHLLPGGAMPKRKTSESVGYDVELRVLVSVWHMDSRLPYLRKTVYDFSTDGSSDGGDLNIAGGIVRVPVSKGSKKTEWAFRLDPGRTVLGGIGFVTAMPSGVFYWVTPRSGLAAKYHIQVTNAPGTIDPDYRGEAGVSILNGGEKPFLLRRGMRIAQILFQRAEFPIFEMTKRWESLSKTERGAGGFGSTGLRG